MAYIFRYLTHPQVEIDPDVPVPDWKLSQTGRARAEKLAASPALRKTVKILSSEERKAVETANIVAAALGIPVRTCTSSGENDRSATGYLEPTEFERMADAFFAEPQQSIRGWERAVDAQARIAQAAGAFMEGNPVGDLLMVGHGGVGTLLYCHLAGHNIDRRFDQPAGGGNLFEFDRKMNKVVQAWQPIEAFIEGWLPQTLTNQA